MLCYFFEANFLVLQAKLMKNVLTACLLCTPVTGLLSIHVSNYSNKGVNLEQ